MLAQLEGGIRESLAVIVDAGAADIGLGVGKGQPLLRGHVVEDAERLGHDLGSNVVSSKNGELQSRHKGADSGQWREREASRGSRSAEGWNFDHQSIGRKKAQKAQKKRRGNFLPILLCPGVAA